MAPLDQLVVIEVGENEGVGMAALLLSDFGARIIRVEEFKKGERGPRGRLCDRGKERVRLDLEDLKEREDFLKLVREADLLLVGCPPGRLEDLGLGGDLLREDHPGLVITSLTPYGQSGPLAGRAWSESTVQAESGFVSTTGPEGGDPVRCGGDIATFEGGMIACIASLMGLLDHRRPSGGRDMDVSMMDSILYGLENQFSLYLKSGVVPKPRGNRYALSAPVGDFACKDGKKIMISVATETQWEAFADALGSREWLENPAYATVALRLEHVDELAQEVGKAFACYTREECIRRLQEKNCIYGCINDFPAVAVHPQSEARQLWLQVEDEEGESFWAPDNPIKMDGRKFHRTKIQKTQEL